MSKLPKLEPLLRSKRQILPQISQRGRSFKFQFSSLVGNTCKFRRKSCTCEECGGTTDFQVKQDALVPVTYIRAHHAKKTNRKMHRNKGLNGRQFSVLVQRRDTKMDDFSTIFPTRMERKSRTLLQSRILEQRILKCKRLLTKDDQSVRYEYFFENELKIAHLTRDFMTTSTFEKTPTRIQNHASQLTFNESQVAYNESQLSPHKIKQKTSVHSPRVYQGIIQVNNLNSNKTLDKYISSSANCSPKRVNIKLPQIKQQVKCLKKKQENTYTRGSPLKLLLELKSQILLQKKMSKQ